MATHFSILAGEFPQTEELVRLKSSTIQSHSCVQHFATLWTTTAQSSQCITKSWSLLNSCPSSWGWYPAILSSVILFSCLQPFQAQGSFLRSQLFASGGLGLGSFSFSISLPNEYSGLIFFMTSWFDLHAVQGTHNSLLQHHSSKASICWCLALFTGEGNGTPLQYSCLENPMPGKSHERRSLVGCSPWGR